MLPRIGLAAGATAFLAALALTMSAWGSAFDTARWDFGRQLVATGMAATDVDAGFEWTGYHSARGVDSLPLDDRLTWYDGTFAGSRPCYAVSSASRPRPGWRLVRTLTYREYVVFGTATLYAYDTVRCRSG
jgi:hypothetical protein